MVVKLPVSPMAAPPYAAQGRERPMAGPAERHIPAHGSGGRSAYQARKVYAVAVGRSTAPVGRGASHRMKYAAATAVLGLAGSVLSAPPTWARQSCPSTEVVFARGTGEPPGIGRVGQALLDSLRSRVGDGQVAAYAVEYPATRDFLKAVDGASDARAHVVATAAECPSTEIVLGGYSQGAAVIDLIAAPADGLFGFGQPLPGDVTDHVAAVTVFGNPSNRLGRRLNDWSPTYGGKTIDLCNGADPVCSNGSDIGAHSLYVESGLPDRAAEFVVGHLQSMS